MTSTFSRSEATSVMIGDGGLTAAVKGTVKKRNNDEKTERTNTNNLTPERVAEKSSKAEQPLSKRLSYIHRKIISKTNQTELISVMRVHRGISGARPGISLADSCAYHFGP
jgi:hypothetical protein